MNSELYPYIKSYFPPSGLPGRTHTASIHTADHWYLASRPWNTLGILLGTNTTNHGMLVALY